MSIFMILVSTICFSGMHDLVMWPENTLNIPLWVNIQDDRHSAKVKY